MKKQTEHTKILVFDKWSKVEMFKKFIKKSRLLKVTYCFDPQKAIRLMMKTKYDIVLLGGDPLNDNLGCVKLYNMMDEWEMTDIPTYITTWNTDEAELLRAMNPKLFYAPFSDVVANIVKEKASQLRKKNKK